MVAGFVTGLDREVVPGIGLQALHEDRLVVARRGRCDGIADVGCRAPVRLRDRRGMALDLVLTGEFEEAKTPVI
jgi:hypothetical protein